MLSIIHYPIFGGPHNRNMRLSKLLAEKGFRTTVLLPDDPGNAADRLRNAGVEVVQLPLQRLRATIDLRVHFRFLKEFKEQIKSIRQLIEDLDIDLVQINGLANPHGALAAKGADVPVVWQLLDTYSPAFLRWTMSCLVRRYSDAIMSTGYRVAEVHPGIIRNPKKLITFYPPVDTELFCPDPMIKTLVRDRLGISEDSIVIGTVGNINLQKGHHNFIKAAAKLQAHLPNAKFIIFGAEHSNHKKHIDSLLKLSTKLGLICDSDLFKLDPTGNVHEWVQALDIFWMTPQPRSEGIPTAMEEAMALEIPVVSFDVGGISELVEEGKAGFIIQDRSIEKLVETTLTQLLDPIRRNYIGKQGRKYITENASLSACIDKHLRAYQIALGKE